MDSVRYAGGDVPFVSICRPGWGISMAFAGCHLQFTESGKVQKHHSEIATSAGGVSSQVRCTLYRHFESSSAGEPLSSCWVLSMGSDENDTTIGSGRNCMLPILKRRLSAYYLGISTEMVARVAAEFPELGGKEISGSVIRRIN